jgi:hypothetical protein
MPSPISQNMVNLVVHPPMNVMMWEHRTFDSKIFGCVKVDYSDFILVTNFVLNLIPYSSFENLFPTYFGTEIS